MTNDTDAWLKKMEAALDNFWAEQLRCPISQQQAHEWLGQLIIALRAAREDNADLGAANKALTEAYDEIQGRAERAGAEVERLLAQYPRTKLEAVREAAEVCFPALKYHMGLPLEYARGYGWYKVDSDKFEALRRALDACKEKTPWIYPVPSRP